MGLSNYQGNGKMGAFFGWVNLDGSSKQLVVGPKRGDFPLGSLTPERVLRSFNPLDVEMAQTHMRNPVLTLGPHYGNPELDFLAMILSMNETKKGTPQLADVAFNGSFSPHDQKKLAALKGMPILGYRPTLIDWEYWFTSNFKWSPSDLKLRESYLSDRGLKGANRLDWADLMALSLVARGPVDLCYNNPSTPRFFTVFDGDPDFTKNNVPYGFFDASTSQPYLTSIDFKKAESKEYLKNMGRFRSVVRGRLIQ